MAGSAAPSDRTVPVPPGFRGAWLTPDSPDYDAARVIYSRRGTRTPAVIAQCAWVGDVQAALRIAQEHGLEIAVRCGGHHAAGWASVQDGLVIDLRRMNDVRIDPATSTAWIGGGTLAGRLVEEAEKAGLAGVTGVTPTVGLGGLLLHLGEGHLSTAHGFGTDQILELEVVTAGGDVLRVAPDSHPGLFWAMRGAGPNFGVVTRLRIRLHPLPRNVLAGMIRFSGDDVDTVTDHVWEILETAPADYHPTVIYRVAESVPVVDVFFVHLGPPDAAQRAIEGLRSCGMPDSDSVTTMSYRDLILLADGSATDLVALDTLRFPPHGDREAQKRILLREHSRLPSSASADPAFHLWPTVIRADPAVESAAPRRDGITVHLYALWMDPSDEDEQLRWLRETAAVLSVAGADNASNTLNHVSTIDDARIRDIYGAEAYDRLRIVKTAYDPRNVFHRNVNIPPHAT